MSGFSCIGSLGSNADHKVDINDPVFSQLKIWQDIDGDGYSAPDELFTLDELSIKRNQFGL